MSELLSTMVVQKLNGDKYTSVPAGHFNGKVVALYFSAHWCPPCRQFTPVLKDFYEELDGEKFEIVFVSFDRSEKDLKEYMKEAHGNWCVIPFGDANIQSLSEKYGVSGIPALVVIKPNGEVAQQNARGDVQGKPPKTTFGEWKKLCGV